MKDSNIRPVRISNTIHVEGDITFDHSKDSVFEGLGISPDRLANLPKGLFDETGSIKGTEAIEKILRATHLSLAEKLALIMYVGHIIANG